MCDQHLLTFKESTISIKQEEKMRINNKHSARRENDLILNFVFLQKIQCIAAVHFIVSHN